MYIRVFAVLCMFALMFILPSYVHTSKGLPKPQDGSLLLCCSFSFPRFYTLLSFCVYFKWSFQRSKIEVWWYRVANCSFVAILGNSYSLSLFGFHSVLIPIPFYMTNWSGSYAPENGLIHYLGSISLLKLARESLCERKQSRTYFVLERSCWKSYYVKKKQIRKEVTTFNAFIVACTSCYRL
jgi:hypothetical protein